MRPCVYSCMCFIYLLVAVTNAKKLQLHKYKIILLNNYVESIKCKYINIMYIIALVWDTSSFYYFHINTKPILYATEMHPLSKNTLSRHSIQYVSFVNLSIQLFFK